MVPVSRSDDPGFCSAQACFRSAQSMAMNAANSVCMVLCPVEIWVRQPLPPRKPYSKVLKARRHLRIRLEAKCIPPLEALRMDIECRSERFVTAGCLPRSTLARSNPADKGTISTARGRDHCGKPFLNISPPESL